VSLTTKTALLLKSSLNRSLAVDVGCGSGQATGTLAKRSFKRVLGVDISSTQLEEAKKRLQDQTNLEFQ